MTNEEIITKINKILAKVHEHFNNADSFWQDKFDENAPEKYKQDRHGLRNWWLDNHRTTTGNQNINMFSFDVHDINALKIPSEVVGCSGMADAFAFGAAQAGLDVNIIAMVDIAEKDKDKPNGHQIIAVKFPDGHQQLIDPGRGRETYEKAVINGKCNVGEKISYNRRDGRTDYVITAILTPIEHAQIDSQEKLAQIYKNPQINPEAREKQAKIQEILKILHNNRNGFKGLLNNVTNRLTEEEKKKYKSNKDYRDIYQNFFILKSIEDFETGKKEYNQQEFEQSVLNNLRTVLKLTKEELEQYKKTQEITSKKLNDMRFALTGDQIMKYRFFASCANAADAFLAVNKTLPKQKQIPEEDISILNSTKFDNLIDGSNGHVIPCVKMPDDTWFAVDPQRTANGHFGFTIPEEEFKEGNKVFHLVGQRHQPYMIRLIGDANSIFHDHNEFLEKASRVKVKDAITFLSNVEKEDHWSPGMRKKIKRELEILSELREEEKKLADQPDGAQKLQSIIEQRRQVQSWKTGIKRIKQKINSINLRDMFAFFKSQETHE